MAQRTRPLVFTRIFPNEYGNNRARISLLTLESQIFDESLGPAGPEMRTSDENLRLIVEDETGICLLLSRAERDLGSAYGASMNFFLNDEWPATQKSLSEYSRFASESTYLSSVGIVPEFRGQGLGALLLEQFMEEARRMNVRYVFSHSLEGPSLAFHQKYGAVLLKRERKWFQDIDAWLALFDLHKGRNA